jgi:hypothetical protein
MSTIINQIASYNLVKRSGTYPPRANFSEEQIRNVQAITEYFSNKGWAMGAIAGILGNMEHESYIIPTTEEIGSRLGYGLVQWTHGGQAMLGIDYVQTLLKKASIPGFHGDINVQIELLNWHLYNEGQWIPAAGYKYSAKEFTQVTDPQLAAQIFQRNFERPEKLNPIRSQMAQGWYEYLQRISGGEVETITPQKAIEKVIEIASAEIGYLEKKSNDQLDDFKANAGSNNFTKYWRDCNAQLQRQPWCACFVSWVFMQAFGKAKAAELLRHQSQAKGYEWPYIYVPYLGQLFTNYSDPQVGDIVMFHNGSLFYHTGIVVEVNGDEFITIEGNTGASNGVINEGEGVYKKSYLNSQSPRTKFARIDYSLVSSINGSGGGGSTTPEQPWKGTGTATCTGDNVNVRATPGGTIIGSLYKGNRFEVDGTKNGVWVHINVSGIGVGYIHQDYVSTSGGNTGSSWTQSGTCTGNGVYVRQTPNGTIMGSVNSGTVLKLDGTKSGEWVHVNVPGIGIGYMHQNYVSGGNTGSSWTQSGTCTGNGVYVRQTPNGTIMGSVNSGTVLKLDGTKSGEWVHVNVPGIGIGYMHQNYVSGGNTGSSWTQSGTCTGNGVYVRQTPNGTIMGSVNSGTVLKLDGTKSGEWVHVNVPGIGIGYMHQNYVSGGNTGSSWTQSGTCTGNGVYVRQTPNGTIMGSVNSGTVLKLDGTKSGEWVHVNVPGIGIGYMHQNYVSGGNTGSSWTQSGTCTGNGVYVRQTPNGTIMGSVNSGTVLKLDGTKSGEWVHVNVPGIGIGYMHQNYVSGGNTESSWTQSGTCTGNGVYVRQTPNGTIMGSVNSGTVLKLDGTKSGEWVHVNVPGIGIGYIHQNFISGSGSNSSWTKSSTCTTDGVNVRETPNGTVIGNVNKGTSLKLDGTKSGEWIHVNIPEIGIGYIHQNFVAGSGSSSSWTKSGICTGNDVYIRETPNGTILGTVSRGTTVKLDGTKSGVWVHVNVSGMGIGYIHQDFIS